MQRAVTMKSVILPSFRALMQIHVGQKRVHECVHICVSFCLCVCVCVYASMT